MSPHQMTANKVMDQDPHKKGTYCGQDKENNIGQVEGRKEQGEISADHNQFALGKVNYTGRFVNKHKT
jgi:hypothetical protein